MATTLLALVNTQWIEDAQTECMTCGSLDPNHPWDCIQSLDGEAA